MSDVKQRCLICGITRQQVQYVRNREGYTLGCGIESNTEDGYDYEELSPKHRWAPWRDKHLAEMGIKPEAFDRYRTEIAAGVAYAACEDTVRGHNYNRGDSKEFGVANGECWVCGKHEGGGSQ
ncbi:hypothetical protein JD276_13160 [Leucobacter sp. CSA1]|uniref:Uncharacterized protein n=1 Tax=Leucobacter chromiisoli TaxID=2796471 RepID=A0A934Q9Y1_9MICO|nr:hypothetical protein [Leucobacter chromiisoli]MBK0419980.1 hypothetical protein [Leucobacter chromiisoli]